MLEYIVIEIAKRRQLTHFRAHGLEPERASRLRRSSARAAGPDGPGASDDRRPVSTVPPRHSTVRGRATAEGLPFDLTSRWAGRVVGIDQATGRGTLASVAARPRRARPAIARRSSRSATRRALTNCSTTSGAPGGAPPRSFASAHSTCVKARRMGARSRAWASRARANASSASSCRPRQEQRERDVALDGSEERRRVVDELCPVGHELVDERSDERLVTEMAGRLGGEGDRRQPVEVIGHPGTAGPEGGVE